MVRYGHKKGLTAMHQCCADGTWYVMLSEDEMRNTLGTAADFKRLLFYFIHIIVSKLQRYFSCGSSVTISVSHLF